MTRQIGRELEFKRSWGADTREEALSPTRAEGDGSAKWSELATLLSIMGQVAS